MVAIHACCSAAVMITSDVVITFADKIFEMQCCRYLRSCLRRVDLASGAEDGKRGYHRYRPSFTTLGNIRYLNDPSFNYEDVVDGEGCLPMSCRVHSAATKQKTSQSR